jgi:hypothetical protein
MGIQESNEEFELGLTRKGLKVVACEKALRAAENHQIRDEYIERGIGRFPISMSGEDKFQSEQAGLALDAINRGDLDDAKSILECIISPSTAAMRGEV